MLDNLNRDTAVDGDCIRKAFALDKKGIMEAMDFDLKAVFVENHGVMEGAEAEDGIGLKLGNRDCIADENSIGSF